VGRRDFIFFNDYVQRKNKRLHKRERRVGKTRRELL
jgi:hypothetical protein